MGDKQSIIGTFHDAITGETIVRELTEQEIADLPEAPIVEENASEEEVAIADEPVDEPIEGEQP